MDLWRKKVQGLTAQVTLLLFTCHGAAGGEMCDSPLVSTLPQSSFRGSSQLSSSHGPGFAKLNRREGAGGWSPLSLDVYQWLEVDLGERNNITAVSTQGRYGSSDWLTAYLLMFSDTGHNWKQYRQEDSIGTFPGNSNADSVVQHKLQRSVIARYVRLIPMDWNPNGRIGLRLETYGCPYSSDVMSFDGRSRLFFRFSPSSTPKMKQSISLKFKTLKNFGILLHAEGQSELSLTLQLEKGKLLLLLQKGRSSSADQVHLMSLGSLLDDQHWHQVTVEQHRSHLNLTVDQSTQWIHIPLGLMHWDYDKISVGADANLGSLRSTVSNRNFYGCLENLLYNDLNLVHHAEQKGRLVTMEGNVTFSCAEPVFVAMTFTSTQSFLWLPAMTDPSSADMLVGFQFRTWDNAGLLLTFDLPGAESGVWMYLRKARLHLRIHEPGRTQLELSTGSGLNDGQWHSVELMSKRGRLSLTVDTDKVATTHVTSLLLVSSRSHFFFGGCPAEGSSEECTNPFSVFQGCMRQLSLNNQPVDLTRVQQRLLGNYSHLQVDMCGILDRCSPSHCEHGSTCSQSWSTFHCNCSGTGYSGATCHSPIYEQSCEAYKHKGNTSGYYYIDVDGSGPIRPQLIYCNMTEAQTWTVIQHNNTELTRVHPLPGTTQHSIDFEYTLEEKQLAAIISQSEHCEQEVAYHCKKSRLLYTQGGSQLSWWIGGPVLGQVQNHWGGAHPGSQECVCHLEGNCVDPKHKCNCDADLSEWTEDSVLLIHKETLPVKSLVLGDVHRSSSEGAYRVGPLRCHGDKNLWNAVFFDKETSYLHFPTFHEELSADISFLFKTTSSSGIFLENLGIKDFIRIELSTPTEILFSFDVGNGPLEVRVDAGTPLNDDKWHHVRAERNVKEASVRLDDLPAGTQEAPPDGHTHLQLNSQLFVGGTASRQKGFRGCIRSLQLNGVTLDLKERAKITPGVQPGCPGHCSSYGSLCQNRGRCVERSNSFSCNCSLSAYNGAFCEKEVSAIFQSRTSIRYAFEDPVVNRTGTLPYFVFSDTSLRAENISLCFSTTQSPALLLYVSSYHSEYLALLLGKHGQLEVRYKLDSRKEAEVLKSSARTLANGQLHTVTISRVTDSVSVQIDHSTTDHFNLMSDVEFNAVRSLVLGKIHDYNESHPDLAWFASFGFTGCLSSLSFNSISPIKAALLQPDTSLVTITGPLDLSNCGSPSVSPFAAVTTHHQSGQSGSVGTDQPLVTPISGDLAVIGGVIAVVIFVAVSASVVTARFFYQRKWTCQSQKVKRVKPEDRPELLCNTQINSQNDPGQNQKEYFI